jgi:hypothetical protein
LILNLTHYILGILIAIKKSLISSPNLMAWMPAAAVMFFRDPDNHLIEYLAMLDCDPNNKSA